MIDFKGHRFEKEIILIWPRPNTVQSACRAHC
jgi:hypothetical protein